MYWLGFIIGTLFGLLVAFLYRRFKRRKAKKKYLKRGLCTSEFQRTNGYGQKTDYDVHAEIGLLERTKTKIKIEVIDLRTSISSNEASKKQIIDIIEGWRDVNDSEIEWFEPHPGDVRGEKIDGILND